MWRSTVHSSSASSYRIGLSFGHFPTINRNFTISSHVENILPHHLPLSAHIPHMTFCHDGRLLQVSRAFDLSFVRFERCSGSVCVAACLSLWLIDLSSHKNCLTKIYAGFIKPIAYCRAIGVDLDERGTSTWQVSSCTKQRCLPSISTSRGKP